MGIFSWGKNKNAKEQKPKETEELAKARMENSAIMEECVLAVENGFRSKLFPKSDLSSELSGNSFESVLKEVLNLYYNEGYIPRPRSYAGFESAMINGLIANDHYSKQHVYYLLEKGRRDLAVTIEYNKLIKFDLAGLIRSDPNFSALL